MSVSAGLKMIVKKSKNNCRATAKCLFTKLEYTSFLSNNVGE